MLLVRALLLNGCDKQAKVNVETKDSAWAFFFFFPLLAAHHFVGAQTKRMPQFFYRPPISHNYVPAVGGCGFVFPTLKCGIKKWVRKWKKSFLVQFYFCSANVETKKME